MLNRRHIRVKVMQALFSSLSDDDIDINESLSFLDKSMHATYDLYLLMLTLMIEVQKKAQRQAEALAGEQGGLLWAVAKDNGKRLAEHKLDSPPVFDGMAAANGRLYVCTMDGAVHCLGDRQ